MTADYGVGYAKPPKHTQFKKGKSGNPGGRKKGAKNIYKSLVDALTAPVVIQLDGKPCKVPRLVAVAIALSMKAAQGNVQAFNSLFDKFLKCAEKLPPEVAPELAVSSFQWTEEDAKLEQYLQGIDFKAPEAPNLAPDEQPH